jgi:hypothetical protein
MLTTTNHNSKLSGVKKYEGKKKNTYLAPNPPMHLVNSRSRKKKEKETIIGSRLFVVAYISTTFLYDG